MQKGDLPSGTAEREATDPQPNAKGFTKRRQSGRFSRDERAAGGDVDDIRRSHSVPLSEVGRDTWVEA